MPEAHAFSLRQPRLWANRLGWSVAALMLLAYGLPYSQQLFAALFPSLPRPVYLQERTLTKYFSQRNPFAADVATAAALPTCPGEQCAHGLRVYREQGQ